MGLVTVDIADMQVSNNPDEILVTYALGSCIAVIVHDPVRVAGGMIHFMLPQSSISPEKAQEKPAMFADTGIPILFERMYGLGCKKQNLVVKVTGGGNIYDDKGLFNIGHRNYVMVRKMFWKNNVMISAEDVGGSKSRTARLFIKTGVVTIRSQGGETEL